MTSTAESLKSAGSGIFDLTGKRAVVTGASRGIGRAITVGLAEHGAEVIAVARTVAGLEETVAAAAGAAGSVRAHAADLSRPETIESAVTQAVETLGGLDILVNNAATDHDSPIEETDLSTFQRVIELNLQSCWLLAKVASPHLSADGGGKRLDAASGSRCGRDGLLEPSDGAGHGDHLGAVFGEADRNRAADSAAGAGHDGSPPGQIEDPVAGRLRACGG